MFSFVIQQQVTQAFQHGNRLFIGHRDGHQQSGVFAIGFKCRCGTTHGDSAAHVAFRAVVQPDALAQIQRLIVNHVGDESGFDSTHFFQTTGVQRL
ncbi:hypothetical protein D3C85_1466080 [compost metagenome]